MTVLEERGLFWWHHEPIPDQSFAPDSCVSGLLKIHDDGRTTLELDGYLSSEYGAMSTLLGSQDHKLKSESIQGLLKVSNKHVLLFNLSRNGGAFSTIGLSYEKYQALNCLVGDVRFPNIKGDILFKELEIELCGLEEWLRLQSIETSKTRRGIAIKYRRKKDVTYDMDDGKLSIHYKINGQYAPNSHSIAMNEIVSLTYTKKKLVAFEDMKKQFCLLDELFIVLTDSEYCISWPSLIIKTVKTRNKYKMYFARLINAAEAPKWHGCPTTFVQLRETFGHIVSEWNKKREQFGPGFYLYLGVRRAVQLYPEHRFVNLIWGIEAFHRTKHRDASSDKIKARICRIIGEVSDRKDKKWLIGVLRHAHEPNLEQRIYDVLTAIPINIDNAKIRDFAHECAARRNDVSHFGAQRHGENYTEFAIDLERKSAALSILYHMLILHEIGVDEKIFNWWIYNGFRSYSIKSILVEVGLLDKSVLKPPSPPQPPAK